jgi:hypothetical protein
MKKNPARNERQICVVTLAWPVGFYTENEVTLIAGVSWLLWKEMRKATMGKAIAALCSILIHLGFAAIFWISISRDSYAPADAALKFRIQLQSAQSAGQTRVDPQEAKGGDLTQSLSGNETTKSGPGGPKKAGTWEEFLRSTGLTGKKWEPLLKRFRAHETLEKDFTEDSFPTGNIADDVPQKYVRRKRLYGELLTRELFPTLDIIDKPFVKVLKAAPRLYGEYTDKKYAWSRFRAWRHGQQYLKEPHSVALMKLNRKKTSYKGVLVFPPEERARYFDKTMPAPKEVQLKNFIDRYAAYDHNVGDLPAALRELYLKNIQRIVFDVNPQNPAFIAIDFFNEALSKEDLFFTALKLLEKFDGSRFHTELLFVLENLFYTQQLGLHWYFKTARQTADSADIRSETLRRLHAYYDPKLKSKKITNYDQALHLFTQRRLEICELIVRSSLHDYGAEDARFLQGLIYWQRESSREKALQIWRNLSFKANDRDSVYAKLQQTIQKAIAEHPDIPGLLAKIDAIIQDFDEELLAKKIAREKRLLWSY